MGLWVYEVYHETGFSRTDHGFFSNFFTREELDQVVRECESGSTYSHWCGVVQNISLGCAAQFGGFVSDALAGLGATCNDGLANETIIQETAASVRRAAGLADEQAWMEEGSFATFQISMPLAQQLALVCESWQNSVADVTSWSLCTVGLDAGICATTEEVPVIGAMINFASVCDFSACRDAVPEWMPAAVQENPDFDWYCNCMACRPFWMQNFCSTLTVGIAVLAQMRESDIFGYNSLSWLMIILLTLFALTPLLALLIHLSWWCCIGCPWPAVPRDMDLEQKIERAATQIQEELELHGGIKSTWWERLSMRWEFWQYILDFGSDVFLIVQFLQYYHYIFAAVQAFIVLLTAREELCTLGLRRLYRALRESLQRQVRRQFLRLVETDCNGFRKRSHFGFLFVWLFLPCYKPGMHGWRSGQSFFVALQCYTCRTSKSRPFEVSKDSEVLADDLGAAGARWKESTSHVPGIPSDWLGRQLLAALGHVPNKESDLHLNIGKAIERLEGLVCSVILTSADCPVGGVRCATGELGTVPRQWPETAPAACPAQRCHANPPLLPGSTEERDASTAVTTGPVGQPHSCGSLPLRMPPVDALAASTGPQRQIPAPSHDTTPVHHAPVAPAPQQIPPPPRGMPAGSEERAARVSIGSGKLGRASLGSSMPIRWTPVPQEPPADKGPGLPAVPLEGDSPVHQFRDLTPISGQRAPSRQLAPCEAAAVPKTPEPESRPDSPPPAVHSSNFCALPSAPSPPKVATTLPREAVAPPGMASHPDVSSPMRHISSPIRFSHAGTPVHVHHPVQRESSQPAAGQGSGVL
eukprot:s1120_g6.t1